MIRNMNDADIAFSPVHQLVPLIARGKLDPVDLVELYLARIARYDGTLHAYVTVFEDTARRMAKSRAMAIGEGSPLGPLHGIPIALKDLCDIAGQTSGAGSLRRSHIVATATSVVVERLLAAGAIVLGRTHMTEFASGSWGTNSVTGTPRNPWDPQRHRVPGGSSSGSAVAVAAGLAPAAIGSDTGGSVRIPASLCGTVGLKPTFGRVSLEGIVPLSPSLDSIGPLTRCVEDAALLFTVLSGDATAGRSVSAELSRGVAGLRFGTPLRRQLDSVAAPVSEAIATACNALRRLGARIDEVEFPDAYFGSSAQMQTIISAEAYAVNAAIVESPGPAMDPFAEARILKGKAIAAAEYIRARECQQVHRAQFLAFLQDFAAVLLPTTVVSALPVDRVDETVPTMPQLTRPVNYLGLSALAVPCGFDDAGLPLSLQIVAPPDAEALLLRIGRAYEQAVCLERHPDLERLAASPPASSHAGRDI
jgi:aspartyl-tRNA(Asn)/glutamyl-tRNA(Gln) amidotransferase subunit A